MEIDSQVPDRELWSRSPGQDEEKSAGLGQHPFARFGGCEELLVRLELGSSSQVNRKTGHMFK